jgi:PAS domain S-box-containing protein
MREDEQWYKYLQWILENIPVGIVVVDPDLNIQAFNPQAEKITGCSADEAIGQSYTTVMRTQEQDIADPLEEAIETGKRFVNQRFYLSQTADKESPAPIRHSASILTDDAGQVLGGLTVFADISRQVALEREIKTQRRYLRDVLRSIPDGVATVDADLHIESWNEAAERITGWGLEQVGGQHCREVFGGTMTGALESLLRDESNVLKVEQRTQLTLSDGNVIPIGFTVSRLRSSDHELAGGVIVFRDIRKLLKRRRQLIQQRRYLSQVLELAPYGIFTVDKDLRIRTFNQAAERLTGFAASYTIGRVYSEIIKVDEKHDGDPLPDLLATGEQAVGVRLLLVDAAGRRFPVRYSAAPLLDADEELTGAIVIFQDVSDIVAAERTKNEFISMVSHELRTPLTSIKGFVTALLDGRAGELNERQRHFLTISQEQSGLLLSLINDLLDLTRLESGKMEISSNRISISELVAHTVEVMQPMAKDKELILTYDVPEDLPWLWADEKRVRQILQNLLSNAIKFTPQDGEVHVLAQRTDEEISLSVEDTGVGIAPEEQERIFDAFYQVENIQTRHVGGTGLGLAIVNRIVEAHGGRLEVESQPGKGSTFTVHLPIARTQTAELREEQPRAESRPSRPSVSTPRPEPDQMPVGADVERVTTSRDNPLILVVDDDRATAAFIRFILEEEGYDVMIAINGTEALEHAAAQHPDVILLDLLMPEVDGFHVLDALKSDSETADIPVCIVSIIEERAKGYRLGAIDYITKPFESEELIAAAERILQPRPDGETTQILVVEDDLTIIELIEVALDAEQFEILTATDGVTALETLRKEHPDLVLLDIMIPKLNGYDFIRQAKADERTSDIPILVLSVRSLEEDINYALRLGAEKYLVKAPGEATQDLSELLTTAVHEFLGED